MTTIPVAKKLGPILASLFPVALAILAALIANVKANTKLNSPQNELIYRLSSLEANPDPVQESRRHFLIDMIRKAWNTNVKSSDLSKITTSMSTLLLAGLTDEFKQSRALFDAEVHRLDSETVNVKLYRQVDALLSIYALTGDEAMLIKAQSNFQRPESQEPEVTCSPEMQVIESRYMADLTANLTTPNQFSDYEKAWQYLSSGLRTELTEARNLNVLIKSYIQSNRQDGTPLLQFIKAIRRFQSNDYIFTSTKFPLAQICNHFSEMTINECHIGAVLALSSAVMSTSGYYPLAAKQHLDLARRFTETCHFAANSTESGLPSSTFRIKETSENASHAVVGSGRYGLQQTLAETYFVMYRVTGEPKYQEYAWELAQAINNFWLSNPNSKAFLNLPETFVGGTLKFLYLTFAPDSFMSLDEWIFTYSGHPLPICGKNPAYPKTKCAGSPGSQTQPQSQLLPATLSIDPLFPIPTNPDAVQEVRRQKVIDMMRKSWNTIAKVPNNDLQQIVASMSTLWLMGLTAEYQINRELFNLEIQQFGAKALKDKLGNGVLGGLLSAYALSGDLALLKSAQDIAQVTGIFEPSRENVYTFMFKVMELWLDGKMENHYLSDITGNAEFQKRIEAFEQLLEEIPEKSIARLVDSLNLNILLKSYLQSNRSNASTLLKYIQTIQALDNEGIYFCSIPKWSLTNICNFDETFSSAMSIQSCHVGAILALGASVMKANDSIKVNRHLQLAREITETCHLAVNSTETGLPSQMVAINENATILSDVLKSYKNGNVSLEPQLAETYFVLYRLTGEPKYQEYAWELVQAINRYLEENKYLKKPAILFSDEVGQINQNELQNAEFFSGTLKYSGNSTG